jgi:Zn-dependent protease with chaperone function
VRLDRANRSFLAFTGIALLLAALVLCGALGGVLMPLALARKSHGGLLGLAGVSLLPVLLFVASIAAALGLGARSLARQLIASRRLGLRVRSLTATMPAKLTAAAMQAGLDGRVVLMDLPESFSFVYGILAPYVAVSRGLLERASPGELRAVLEHERYHVCNLDPLKIVLLRALSGALFCLPVLDSLHASYVAGRELAADRRAVAVCGRRPLAGALLKVVRGPAWSELDLATAIGGPELLDVRILQLETGVEPRLEGINMRRVMLSLLGAALLAAAFLASVSSFGGPSAVQHAAGTGLANAIVLGGLACAAPFAGAALLVYSLIALRASRPIRVGSRAYDRVMKLDEQLFRCS